MSEGARVEALLLDSTVSVPPARPQAETGWDPYEVWRTRILAPRLAEPAVTRGDTSTMVRLSQLKKEDRPRITLSVVLKQYWQR